MYFVPRLVLVVCIPLFFGLNGCASKPTHAGLQGAALPELIPLREFFVNVEANLRYTVSPDGKKAAWLAVSNRRLSIHYRRVDSDDVRVVDSHSSRNIYHYTWAQDSRRLLFLQDQDGNEQHHIYLSDTSRPDAKPIDLTPLPNTRARIHRVVRTDPDHILVTHNQRDNSVFDLYRLNINTATMERIAENPGDVLSWITDDKGQLRGRVRRTAADRKQLELWEPSLRTWRSLIDWDFDETVRVWSFTPDDLAMWVSSNRGRDRISLVRLDLNTGAETLIYQEPDVDISSVHVSRRTRQPVLATAMAEYQRLHFFDPSVEDDAKLFRRDGRQGLRIVSVDDSERVAVVAVFSDHEVRHYLFDRDTREKQLLGQHPLSNRAGSLARMEPVSFAARDGLTLHGYLTRPVGYRERPLPLVLLVHGGPWSRDTWGLNSTVQFLANRGYAVLQVNFRGSTGYGRTFTEAAVGEFAGRMHTDLLDGVNWAVQHGIADPEKICIFGGSYGGYAALVGLTFTPEVFACGIDVVGPSNLVTLVESVPVYWKNWMPYWYKYVGDPRDPIQRAAMEQRSPLFRVDAVIRPLLIVQGANDPRVTQKESDQIVAALRAANKEVDYLLFPDEGHGISHWKNRLRFFRRLEDFLAEHLGGRSAGFDYYELGLLVL